MRFSVVAASLFAGAVMAESTIYQTEEVTITSCAPTVTNCPARSTVVSTTSYPVTTSKAASSSTWTPAVNSTSSASGVPTWSAANSTTWAPVTSVAPTSSVSLSTVYYTTCIPTTTYKVVTVSPVASASAGIPTGASNGTAPTTPAKPSTPVTAGAAGLQGSVVVAALAGAAAFLFA